MCARLHPSPGPPRQPLHLSRTPPPRLPSPLHAQLGGPWRGMWPHPLSSLLPSPSISRFFFLPLSASITVSLSLSLSASFCLCLSVSLCLSLCLFLSLSLSVLLCPCPCLLFLLSLSQPHGISGLLPISLAHAPTLHFSSPCTLPAPAGFPLLRARQAWGISKASEHQSIIRASPSAQWLPTAIATVKRSGQTGWPPHPPWTGLDSGEAAALGAEHPVPKLVWSPTVCGGGG